MTRNLAKIAAALLSDDAMRWAPDAPGPGYVHPPAVMWDPHATATWPTWDAMARERFDLVLARFGVVLTDWQYELVGRMFKVPVQMLSPVRAEVERRVRLRHLHTDYHRRTRRSVHR